MELLIEAIYRKPLTMSEKEQEKKKKRSLSSYVYKGCCRRRNPKTRQNTIKGDKPKFRDIT